MKVLIDADACPVVDQAVSVCRERTVPCVLLCDTAHEIRRDGVETLVFDKGADSVDLLPQVKSELGIPASKTTPTQLPSQQAAASAE